MDDRVWEKLDNIDAKLDTVIVTHGERLAKAETDIKWLGTQGKVVISLLLGLAATAAGAWFKSKGG